MENKNIIKERRIALNLTQLDIAKAVGVSEATVSRWESGAIENMRRDRIEALASILQIPESAITSKNRSEELIDVYAKGAKKWASDFRFSEDQQSRIQEWLADSISHMKSVVEAMANSDKRNGKIVIDDALAASLENNSHWARNAVNYVNQDYSCNFEVSSAECLPPDEEKLLEMYRQLNPQGKEYILQTLVMATQVYIKNASAPDLESSAG